MSLAENPISREKPTISPEFIEKWRKAMDAQMKIIPADEKRSSAFLQGIHGQPTLEDVFRELD